MYVLELRYVFEVRVSPVAAVVDLPAHMTPTKGDTSSPKVGNVKQLASCIAKVAVANIAMQCPHIGAAVFAFVAYPLEVFYLHVSLTLATAYALASSGSVKFFVSAVSAIRITHHRFEFESGGHTEAMVR
jgi:hypothetical protein